MKSIADLPSERASETILAHLVLGRPPRCPDCRRRLGKGSGYYWCKPCRSKIRPRAATWLRGSNLPARAILALLICWQRKVAPGAVQTLLGVSYPTIRLWYGRFRANLPADHGALDGLVEVDEAFFGRQKHANQAIVAGAVERGTNRLKLAVVADRQTETLEEFVLSRVTSDSLVHTDAWGGYATLEVFGLGHDLTNHSKGNFGSTNRIEAVWSTQKRQLRRMYGQISVRYLPSLLMEWEARYNYPELFSNPLAYLQTTVVPHPFT